MTCIPPARPVSTRLPCAGRKKFSSKDAASAAALNIAQRHGRRRLPYPCGLCNGWHLSAEA